MRLLTACLLAVSVAGCVEEVDPSLRAERDRAATAAPAAASAEPVQVAVTVRECAVQLSRDRVPAGAVAFQVRNDGTAPQELVLHGPQGEWASGPVPAGETGLLSVSLVAGTYRLGCAAPAGGAETGAALTVD